jgi:hypothetical protein
LTAGSVVLLVRDAAAAAATGARDFFLFHVGPSRRRGRRPRRPAAAAAVLVKTPAIARCSCDCDCDHVLRPPRALVRLAARSAAHSRLSRRVYARLRRNEAVAGLTLSSRIRCSRAHTHIHGQAACGLGKRVFLLETGWIGLFVLFSPFSRFIAFTLPIPFTRAPCLTRTTETWNLLTANHGSDLAHPGPAPLRHAPAPVHPAPLQHLPDRQRLQLPHPPAAAAI